jgi:hypothetical protein
MLSHPFKRLNILCDTESTENNLYRYPILDALFLSVFQEAAGDHGGESEYESADEDIVRSPKPAVDNDEDEDDDEEEVIGHDDENENAEDEEEDYGDEEEEEEVEVIGGKEATAAAVRPSMERERGDGEESVDDDKDKKNPQAGRKNQF